LTRTDDTPVPAFADRLRLDGRGFVLIGAGQGIGRQAAHALTQAGARVVCVDREADLADDIAAEVDGVAWSGDATDRDEVERLFDEATAAVGPITGIVDIVGMAQYQGLLDIDDANWTWHHDICLRHAYLAITIGGRRMKEAGGGTMAFVASVSGITAAPLHAAYGAAKAGLMALVKSAAVELGPHNIRVNAVAPGLVWTPRVSGYLGEKGREANLANSPVKRVAEPADIASALLFLSSDLAQCISGQTVVVDCGVMSKFPYPMPEG
jgi:NAD(P)-dependent dehydrogenase (short-subunit alcohol dehydrogenase family)